LLAIRFHRLILRLGVKSSVKESILIYLAGLAFGITPVGAGQIIKSHIIKKKFSVPISITAPVVLVEKWNELTAVIILLLFLFLFATIYEVQIITVIGIVISLLILGIMKNKQIFSISKKIFSRIRPFRKYTEIIENSQNTLNILMKPSVIAEGLLITIPAQILEALTVFLVFQEIGLGLDFEYSTQVFFFCYNFWYNYIHSRWLDCN